MGKLRSRLPLAAALGSLVLCIAVLAWFRRSPDVLEGLWRAGNVLATHEGSGITIERLARCIASVEFVIIASIVASIVLIAKRRHAIAAVAAISASFVALFGDSITRYVTVVEGVTYVGICDDAFVSMRYARNVASGIGPFYNVGERVEGYSNLAWTLAMAVPLAFGVPEGLAPLIVLVLGGGLLLASALLVRATLDRLGIAPVLQTLAAMIVLFDASTFDFTIAGLETPLVTFAAALVVFAAVADRERLVLIGLVLLCFSRADGAVLASLLVVWSWLERYWGGEASLVEAMKRTAPRAGAVLVGAACATLWHYGLYGELAPNTYYLKVYGLPNRIVIGMASYGVRGLVYYGLPAGFVFWAGYVHERARRARRLMIPVCGAWIYGVYVGGDAFNHLRFVGPVTPMLWMASAIALDAAWRYCARTTRALSFAALGLVAPTLGERGVLGSAWARSNWIRDNVFVAKTLERNVQPGTSVATFYAGMVPYLAPRLTFVDMLGKTEAHIAKSATVHGLTPGHNKFDFAYIYNERKPDVTFTALTCPDVDAFLSLPAEEQSARVRSLPPTGYQAPWYQLVDPTFLERYHGRRVALRVGDEPIGHRLGCWWIRDDALIPDIWQLALR
jgi:hypothetical protein